MKIYINEKEFEALSNAQVQINDLIEAGPDEQSEENLQIIYRKLGSILRKYKTARDSKLNRLETNVKI